MSAMIPKVDRPAIPAEYGITKARRHVEWGHVEDRLAADRVYWIATVSRQGRPRMLPIDGLYLDGVIWVGGSHQTGWVRDLADNPHVAIHLDGVDDVVIVHGEAEMLVSVDEETAERLAAASRAKFPEYGMQAAFYAKNGAIAIRPRKVISWTDISADPTRFTFD
jgi:general stress protein 26